MYNAKTVTTIWEVSTVGVRAKTVRLVILSGFAVLRVCTLGTLMCLRQGIASGMDLVL